MLRPIALIALLMMAVQIAASQSVPAEFLSTPVRLALNKPTQEVKAGSSVVYTVTLRDAADRPAPATSNLQLEVQTPSGTQTVVLPAGQSSANFTWQAQKSGVKQMTVRSGKLHPATGLVLVVPPAPAVLPQQGVPQKVSPAPKSPISKSPIAGIITESAPALAPPPQASPPPPPAAAPQQAKKIQLYVEPIPVYGNAANHLWTANISVAALGDQDSLAPVISDVTVHINASSGTLSSANITLPAGEYSNFANPIVLTANRSGEGRVDAISSLGPAGPIEVNYLQPPPSQLRVSLGAPVLAGAGSSSVTVQVCMLDESGAPTSSDQDVSVALTAPVGQLAQPSLTIPHGLFCSGYTSWTSGSGAATITAESPGLTTGTKSITFPPFPWYLVVLAALGGVAGALVKDGGWSHTWRALTLGAILGVIFFIFARFGALVLPPGVPVALAKIPVVSGTGAFAIGFLGGLLGRKFWQIGDGPAPVTAPGK